MKGISLMVLGLGWAIGAIGAVPDVVLTYKSSSGGFGTFAGRLATKPTGPVGITVANGGLKFSTVTDKDGHWGVTFRQIAVMSDIVPWSLENPQERGAALSVSSPFAIESRVPSLRARRAKQP